MPSTTPVLHHLLPHQNVTHLFVHGLGVLDPATPLVTFTPVPEGAKFTLPGPRVTFVYDAVTFDGEMRDGFRFRSSKHDTRRIHRRVEIDGAGL